MFHSLVAESEKALKPECFVMCSSSTFGMHKRDRESVRVLLVHGEVGVFEVPWGRAFAAAINHIDSTL